MQATAPSHAAARHALPPLEPAREPARQPTVGQALTAYLERNGFDPDYADRWLPLPFGPLVLTFPNPPARRHAVRFHDVHHALTGYDTDWAGEGEIGAWELAVGCGRHWVGWLLNAQALVLGLTRAPRRVWRAFRRGRRCQGLYRTPGGRFPAEVLDEPLTAARERLGLTAPLPPATAADAALFAMWMGLGLVASVASLPSFPFALATTYALRLGSRAEGRSRGM